MDDPARIRNLGIIAHIDAGKTTVTERILFYAGVEHRMGEVNAGTTVMDWMEEERERGITITAAVTHLPWREHLIQIVDTPGHVDFTAEVERCLRVLDGAALVVDGVAGVQSQTESVTRRARKHGVPLLAFVNKMDRAGADFERALRSLRAKAHPGAIAVQLPRGAGADFAGVVDLVHERLLRWDAGALGRTIAVEPLPQDEIARAAAARDALCAAVAEQDDALADAWLARGTLAPTELSAALRRATLSGRLMPVLCGAALRNVGVQPLLDAAVDWLPSPIDLPPVRGRTPRGAQAERPPRGDAPACALAFKVFHDAHGDLVYFRLYSGTVRDGDVLVNARDGQRERLHPLFWMHAETREKRDTFGPGGLFAVPGLKRVRTGDTLCAADAELLLEPPVFPAPVLRRAVEAREPADRANLADALALLLREDPTLALTTDEETGGWLLAGLGELHLEVAAHRLQRDFRLAVRMGEPRVSLTEAAVRPAAGSGRAEIPGEAPISVEVRVRLEPRAEESVSLLIVTPPGAVSEALRRELLDPRVAAGLCGRQGHPLRHTLVSVEGVVVRPAQRIPPAELVVGALHAAVEQGLAAGGVVLEPVMDLTVETPEAYLTPILADLQQRLAEIRDVAMEEGDQRIVLARVPLSRLMAYSTAIRSLSQGKAVFDLRPAGLAPLRGASA